MNTKCIFMYLFSSAKVENKSHQELYSLLRCTNDERNLSNVLANISLKQPHTNLGAVP